MKRGKQNMSQAAKCINPPSIKAIGSLIMNKIFKNGESTDKPNILAGKLISIIEATDISVIDIFSTCILILADSKTSSQQQESIKIILQLIAEKYFPSPYFHSHVICSFNLLQLPSFPGAVLSSLSYPLNLIFLTYACSSKYEQEAREYLNSKFIPSLIKSNITLDIPPVPLYELTDNDLSQLFPATYGYEAKPKAENISLISTNNKINSVFYNTAFPISTPYSTPFDSPSIPIKTSIKPSLYDAVLESDPRSLTSHPLLRKIFDFFDDFNATHAAAFITSIASPSCSFRSYFQNLNKHKNHVLLLYLI